MNLIRLESLLLSENIPTHAYSLKGGLPNEAYCITSVNGVWQVYYSERGSKAKLTEFQSEDDACQYFYNWMMSVFRNKK